MIKANELRMGNIIWDDETLYAKVIGLKPFDHSTRCDEAEGCEVLIDIYRNNGRVDEGYVVSSSEITPIPLTPELLERCGFERVSEQSVVLRKTIAYSDENSPCTLQHWIGTGHISVCRAGSYSISVETKYLHQLQNLYFALTNEELEVQGSDTTKSNRR